MLGVRSLIVGENFACGSGRRGNIEYLGKLGACLGFDVRPVPLWHDADNASAAHCSSSETRRLIQQGDIAGANAMLDRPHQLSGMTSGPGGPICRVIDVVVPRDLCSPPPGDYAGTVKTNNVAAPWTRAILQVREQRPQVSTRTIRLLLENDTEIAPGNAVTVRFLDRARPATNRVAMATTADVK
jgi:riboflavin kinase/FMN adenylyltransferase